MNSEFAIVQPGSHLFGQTFKRETKGIVVDHVSYTAPADLAHFQKQAKHYIPTMMIPEYFGYFLPGNVHNGSDDSAVWERANIKHSNFGREILHCKQSDTFNPWSVMERFPNPAREK